MWRDVPRGTAIGRVGVLAAIAIWWSVLEACPQLTKAALQVARLTVLYVVARG